MNRRMTVGLGNLLLLAVGVILLLGFCRLPIGHSLLYGSSGLLNHWPNWIIPVALGTGVILTWVRMMMIFEGYIDPSGCFSAVGMCILLILALCGYWIWTVNAYGNGVAKLYGPYEETNVLPDIDPRWHAFEIGKKTLEGRGQEPTRKVGDLDPFYDGTTIKWRAPWIPNGLGNWLNAKLEYIMSLSPDGDVLLEKQTFNCGEGMGITDSVFWALIGQRYHARYPEIFYWRQPDESYFIVAPFITYRLRFPALVPVWGGVMIVRSNCVVEELTPEQAMNDPRLAGAQIYPEELVRIETEKWGFRFGGWANAMFTHREQVDIPKLPRSENEQPYYAVVEGMGPQWVVVGDAHGKRNEAVAKMFFHDVAGPQMTVVNAQQFGTLVGPLQAVDYAKGATTGLVWREGEEGTHILLEPRPLIKEGTLYWMLSVTTINYRSTAVVVLVNASTPETEVLHFCTPETLDSWNKNQGKPDTWPCSNTQVDEQPVPLPVVPAGDLQGLSDKELFQERDELFKRLFGVLLEIDHRELMDN